MWQDLVHVLARGNVEMSVIVWLHHVKMSSSQIVYVCLPKTDSWNFLCRYKRRSWNISIIHSMNFTHVWEDNIKIDLLEVVQGLDWSGAWWGQQVLGGLLWRWYRTFNFRNMRGVPWLAEDLRRNSAPWSCGMNDFYQCSLGISYFLWLHCKW